MATKTTVLTGATSGIGEATALALAKKGHALYLLVRNVQKGEELKERLIKETGNKDIFVVKCDLSDLASVAAAADELNAKLFNINVLINNAGGIFNKYELSKDGYEMTFALNHLGHFLLTTRLMPLLEKGHARIINLSSDAHKMGRPDFDNLQKQEGYSAMRAYGTAKLFNIYFTKSLAEKYADKGITAYALHPGIVKTSFGAQLSGFGKALIWLAGPFMITPEKGAETTIYLATEAKIESKSGKYFNKKKVTKPAAVANNVNARNQLWNRSEQLINKIEK
ncbi:SDR family oxidoreductase [Mucilaginibacter sp.]|uniref:SDR family oxidoreductase n=1 Tax=Mucilaginibacter sp. TaxID=1882438 RepID=UPI00261057AE|nr:SDR family oxidoreductase [Mucilaginibacter sp.]MDB4927090.1 NAD(P)-dependent dehydrogenase, short-chain alcohol dehydrogenase family [Mucilaginibacter sp.]